MEQRDESKATARPWSYRGEQMKHDSSRVIHGCDGMVVAMAVDFNSFDRDLECEANARLIVAAVNERAALLAERDALLIDRCLLRVALAECERALSYVVERGDNGHAAYALAGAAIRVLAVKAARAALAASQPAKKGE